MKTATINQPPPLLAVSEWVQGHPVNFDQLLGHVVLVEIFQVNCPGCFLHALPNAINLHQKYANRGLIVLGIATAFEDFDKNTLENLKRLVNNAEVIGDTQKILSEQGLLIQNCLPYHIPFPLAMDRLHHRNSPVTSHEVNNFIQQHFAYFDNQPIELQLKLKQRVYHHLESLQYHAETFECFALKGTPSHILVDKQGILREVVFGIHSDLENIIQNLLRAEYTLHQT